MNRSRRRPDARERRDGLRKRPERRRRGLVEPLEERRLLFGTGLHKDLTSEALGFLGADVVDDISITGQGVKGVGQAGVAAPGIR